MIKLSERFALIRSNRSRNADPITEGQMALCALNVELSRLADLIESVDERAAEFTPAQAANLMIWASAACNAFERSRHSIARLNLRLAQVLS